MNYLILLKNKLVWFQENLLVFTWLRVCSAVIFVIFYSFLSESVVVNYYRKFTSPPAFRNMDQTCLPEIINDYMDAQIEDPKNTLIVIGDCVAYGHGVIHSFADYLDLKNIKIVNISMHSFAGILITSVIDEALRRGVRKFLIQLHPFGIHQKDAETWISNLKIYPHQLTFNKNNLIENGCEAIPKPDFKKFDQYFWRIRSMESEAYASAMPDAKNWYKLSFFLRNDFLAKWFLFRNRHAFDHALGINRSFYTKMTGRSDDFINPLPESQQIEIFKNIKEFINIFIIKDPQYTKETLQKYSLVLRLAIQLKNANAQAVFVMTQTNLNLVKKYTPLPPQDLIFVSNTLKKIVEKYEYSYYDLLSPFIPEDHVVHYDSITVKGQKHIADILNPELSRIFLNQGT